MNSETPVLIKSLVTFFHPVLMIVTLVLTFYGLYLGIQVRRTHSAEAVVRKEMIKAKYNQRHFQIGAILLVFWVVGSVIGMAATYALYSKLFFSPHLIGGLSSICLAAIAAAFVPSMLQGKNWARIAHITLAILVLYLSISQTVTGFEIVREMLGEIFQVS
jgi:hypothetical protein